MVALSPPLPGFWDLAKFQGFRGNLGLRQIFEREADIRSDLDQRTGKSTDRRARMIDRIDGRRVEPTDVNQRPSRSTDRGARSIDQIDRRHVAPTEVD